MSTPKRNPGRGREPLPVLLDPHELVLRTWIQFVRTFTRMERRLESELEVHGLSLPQFDILATLHRDEGITQRELAERLLVTKGNICGMIDRMEASGWVERRPDPADRRANRLFMTTQGRTLLTNILPQQIEAVSKMMSVLSAGEMQTLYQSLSRLEEGAE